VAELLVAQINTLSEAEVDGVNPNDLSERETWLRWTTAAVGYGNATHDRRISKIIDMSNQKPFRLLSRRFREDEWPTRDRRIGQIPAIARARIGAVSEEFFSAIGVRANLKTSVPWTTLRTKKLAETGMWWLPVQWLRIKPAGRRLLHISAGEGANVFQFAPRRPGQSTRGRHAANPLFAKWHGGGPQGYRDWTKATWRGASLEDQSLKSHYDPELLVAKALTWRAMAETAGPFMRDVYLSLASKADHRAAMSLKTIVVKDWRFANETPKPVTRHLSIGRGELSLAPVFACAIRWSLTT